MDLTIKKHGVYLGLESWDTGPEIDPLTVNLVHQSPQKLQK